MLSVLPMSLSSLLALRASRSPLERAVRTSFSATGPMRQGVGGPVADEEILELLGEERAGGGVAEPARRLIAASPKP